jgi:xanthine dehydrogenase YagR molybdenum-binding subunit
MPTPFTASPSPTAPPRTNASGPRVDGPLKVTGAAMYSSDHNLPGMLYAVPVCATIASGTITAIDTARAQSMPGVKAVYTRANIGKIFRCAPPQGFSGILDEKRPPLDDDTVRYFGQYVAAVVALTYEQAIAAANAVKVTYKATPFDVSTHFTPEQAADKPQPHRAARLGRHLRRPVLHPLRNHAGRLQLAGRPRADARRSS